MPWPDARRSARATHLGSGTDDPHEALPRGAAALLPTWPRLLLHVRPVRPHGVGMRGGVHHRRRPHCGPRAAGRGHDCRASTGGVTWMHPWRFVTFPPSRAPLEAPAAARSRGASAHARRTVTPHDRHSAARRRAMRHARGRASARRCAPEFSTEFSCAFSPSSQLCVVAPAAAAAGACGHAGVAHRHSCCSWSNNARELAASLLRRFAAARLRAPAPPCACCGRRRSLAGWGRHRPAVLTCCGRYFLGGVPGTRPLLRLGIYVTCTGCQQ